MQINNRSRVENGSRDTVKMRPVLLQCKDSFDKACLNVLRAEVIRWVGAELKIEWDNEAGIRGNDKVGIRKDNKTGIGEQNDKIGIGG